MASSDATGSVRHRKKRTFLVLVFLLAICLILLLAMGVLHIYGYIFGSEFSPQTFQERQFHFYAIPGANLQIGPTNKNDSSTDLTTMIRKNYLPKKSTAQRWDPVSLRRGLKRYPDGDAKILLEYLSDVNKDGDFTWLEWSDDHPKLAKILWPEIVHVAQLHVYTFIPDIMRTAREAKDAGVFRAKLNTLLASRYRRRGEQCNQLGEDEKAVLLFEQALRLSPGHKTDTPSS